ncbi:glycosyltransferase family 4 protein [Acidothermaceae bacterium B102]|nr:glycosyltransferase family 4 protein [Acidothermaceae bacterium B102]
MRVGIVCPYTWHVPGGVQAHIRDLAEELIREGHHVSVIASADDDEPLPPYVEPAGRAVPVRYNGSVARLTFGPISNARVRRWLREGEFDVLHVHEPAAPSLSLLACYAADGPIVATFHAANPRSRWMRVGTPALTPALEKIRARIAVSSAARRTLVEHFGGDAVVIPNGVDVEAFRGASPLPGREPNGATVGFLGRFDEPRKGFAVLLAAFVALAPSRPELRLLVAGPGDAQDVLDDLPPDLAARVDFLGMVSDADKVRFFQSIDVYVAPNVGQESFGVILLEAAAAGVPIVASDLDAFARVLDDGVAGELTAVGDVASLTAGLARVLDDPVRRQQLRAGGDVVARRYDWASVAHRVLEVYETVTAGAEATVSEDDATESLISRMMFRGSPGAG